MSFEVVPALNVAPLGVSVLPLRASLSACNLDMPLSTALGAGCGGIPNRSWTGFVVGVSCMPSPKGLFAGLFTRDYSITVHIYFSQFISSLKVGAFLLISFCKGRGLPRLSEATDLLSLSMDVRFLRPPKLLRLIIVLRRPDVGVPWPTKRGLTGS